MQFILQSPTQSIVEELIRQNDSNLSKLLYTVSFMNYCRNADPFAIEFICKNVDQMLNIIFVDYNLIPKEQLEQYSEKINNVWEIIELNLEPILIQIEIHWQIIFELRWKQFVPDIQWGLANKILNIVKERDPQLLEDVLKTQDFLISFLPFLKIHSVSQMLVAFFEIGFHQSQLDFLNKGLQFFKKADILSVINFTNIVHEIMTRIFIDQQLGYILQGEFLKVMFDVIDQDKTDPIILKNAAHIISLISNYYTMDMQNINLDDPDAQDLIIQFKQSPFYQNFDVQKIAQILQKSVQKKIKVGLFTIKLVEIVDNLVRITDLQLWDQVADSNILELIFKLANQYRNSDIFSIFVENMVSFIFDKALIDYHPFWAYYLISRYRLQNKNVGFLRKLIYNFQINLENRLSKESDGLPFVTTLREIENELKISQIWNKQKQLFQNYEERNKTKLGEDSQTPKREEKIKEFEIEQLCIQADEQTSRGKSAKDIKSNQSQHINPTQLFEEIQFSVFENISLSKNEKEFETNSQGEDSEKIINQTSQENQFYKNNFDKLPKKFLGLSASLQNENSMGQFLSSSLQNDLGCRLFNLKKANSLQLSQEFKKEGKQNLEKFKIEIFKNKKVLKKQDNSILKVDEIDLQANFNVEFQEVKTIDQSTENKQNSQIS